MKVQDVMTRSPTTCFIQDPLHIAAQKLWERDCGCLPVVDPEQRPLAMITDRDICMAAFTTGKPLHELQVGQAMSKDVIACRDGDDLAAAGVRMARHGVRRVPVVDSKGVLCGVLSLNDLAVNAAKDSGRASGLASEALRVLCAVSAHREPQRDDEDGEARDAKPSQPAPSQSQGLPAPSRDGKSSAATPANPAIARMAPSTPPSGESTASASA
jgi:CBS domain-containing protein